jgi:hypothetical protein
MGLGRVKTPTRGENHRRRFLRTAMISRHIRLREKIALRRKADGHCSRTSINVHEAPMQSWLCKTAYRSLGLILSRNPTHHGSRAPAIDVRRKCLREEHARLIRTILPLQQNWRAGSPPRGLPGLKLHRQETSDHRLAWHRAEL